MTPQQLQQLIYRYQSGIATTEERQQLEDYWQQALTDDSAIRELSPAEYKQLEQRLYQGALNRIQQQEPGAFRPVRRLYTQRWMQVAAGLTGLLLLVGIGRYWMTKQVDSVVAYQTQYGEKKQVVLPDSSVVWLNGHSSLRYVPDATGNRQVWLAGEALFSVKHTPTNNKFVVHTTNHLNIEVLGTVFNVLDRRGGVSVVLRSGSVRVTDQMHRQADVLLKPGEMVNQTAKQPLLAKSAVQAAPRMAWKDGAMYLENKQLGEIFDWIEDTYGLQVECSSSLRAETFAGTIPTDSIDSFFDMIPKLYQVRVQRDGRTYRIIPAPSNRE